MYILPKQAQLYRFLDLCNKSTLEKTVLDCGAGGIYPPLAIFSECGYKTYGIELFDSQVEKATSFSKDMGLKLNIVKGDMRILPFGDESLSFIYSYNSIFHMRKVDILNTINEVKRVLHPDGLCCINFLSTYDEGFGQGDRISDTEFLQIERGEKVIHSYFELEEAEDYFKDMKIIFKETRILESIYDNRKAKQSYIDYIVKKNAS